MAWALRQRVATRAAQRHVLLVLANYAGEDGRNAFPAVERIGGDTGMSRKGVQNILRELEEMALIRRGNQKIAEAYIDRADKRPVVYDLNLSLVSLPPPDENYPQNEGDRGERHSPRDGAGRTSFPNGANVIPERGERGTPDPSLNHQESVNARARGDAAPDGASPHGGEGRFGESTAGTETPVDAASDQGAMEGDADRAAGGAAKQPMTDADRERMWRQNFIIDWLIDGKSPSMVCERIGFSAERMGEAEFERAALSQRETYIKGVYGFVKWATACLEGDVAAEAPIAPVKRLMTSLADPQRRALMARRLALLRDRDAEIRAAEQANGEAA